MTTSLNLFRTTSISRTSQSSTKDVGDVLTRSVNLLSNNKGFKCITTFQNGHNWYTGSGGTFVENDTNDFAIGNQCVSISHDGNKYIRNVTIPNIDFTNKVIGVLLKINNTNDLSDLSIYVGNNTSNFVRYDSIQGSQGAKYIRDNEWSMITLSQGEDSTITGSPDLTNVEFLQIRIASNGSTVDASFNGFFIFDQASEARLSISFDDGYESIYTLGKRELDKYMLPATVYMVPSYMDQSGRLSKIQLDKMKEDGWEIGGHQPGNNQKELTSSQLHESFKEVIKWSNDNDYNITSYAYPGGEWASLDSEPLISVRDIAQQYFDNARVIFRGNQETLPVSDLHKLRVYYITDNTPAEVQAAINKAIANGEWVHLVFHNIVESGATLTTEYNVADFSAICQIVNDSDIRVGTVEQVLKDYT